jgi:hypothetical protein
MFVYQSFNLVITPNKAAVKNVITILEVLTYIRKGLYQSNLPSL